MCNKESVDSEFYKKNLYEKPADIENLDSDIVIIGGGGSGLVAAVRAAEAGAKNVIVLEKAGRVGGNAWLAVCMFALNSSEMNKLETKTSIDDVFKDTMNAGEWAIDSKVVRAYLEKTGEVTRWLENKGLKCVAGGFDFGGKQSSILEMASRQEGYKGRDPSMGPGFIGSTIVEIMLKECHRLGIKILTKTKAIRILTDNEGNVNGVIALSQDRELKINSKSVIISAGGFGANKEMMQKFFPEYYREDGPINRLCMGHSTGDGILMAQEIGAGIGDDIRPGIIGPAHHPWEHSVHTVLGRSECIWVNKNGKRFIPENVGFATRALNKQPGSVLYALIDSDTKRFMQKNPSEMQKAMNGVDWLTNLDDAFEKEGSC